MIISAIKQREKFEKNLQDGSFLSRKMLCEYNSHKDRDISPYYVLNDLSLMVMGENLSVSGIPDRDELDEILSFCSFMGIYGLECARDNLPIESRHIMNLMSSDGDGKEKPSVICDENLYGFSQFCRTNFVGSAFDTIYSYFARKVNGGFSHIYYLQENGKILSGGLATDYGDDIYITFLSTDRRNRKKGMASDIVNHILSQNTDKRHILMCENELLDFYKKLGFEKTDEIYLYVLREEQI